MTNRPISCFRSVALSWLIVASASIAFAQSQTRPHVQALASERTEGRLAGTNDERLAADYIVSQLQKIGARPLPGQKDFRLPFEFTAGASDGGSTIAVGDKRSGARALSFSDNGDASGPVVFAGYGIVVPESQGFG